MGLIIGGTVSSFSEGIGEFGTDKEYENFVRFGAVVGLHSRFQVTKLFALRGEVLFNGRGGSFRKEAGIITIGGDGGKKYHTKNYRLNYFDIPLMGEIDFMHNTTMEKLHVRLAIGASVGLPVASSLRYNGYAPTGSTAGPLVDVDEDYEVTKVGHATKPVYNAIAELSFDFLNGHDTPLFFRLRYTGAVNDVYDQDKIGDDNFRTKMTTWSLAFGFYFMKL